MSRENKSMELSKLLSIKPLTFAHYPTWLPLWQSYQAFYKTTIPDEVTAITWKRLLDPSEPMAGVLAFDGENAIGFVHWIFHRSCWTIGNYCYLQDLFVAEGRRGAGVGRCLIEYVYDVAKAADCSRVYWLTHETNQEAMSLYDRVAARSGFVQYKKVIA